MKKRLLLGAILTALGIAVVLYVRLRDSREEGMLFLSGNVEVTEVNLAFRMPGRVTAIFSDEGDPVAAGQKLAVLNNDEYEAQAAQSRANLRDAEAVLQKAKKDYDRAEALFKKEVLSDQQRDAARTALEVARARRQQALAALRTAEVKLGDTVILSPLTGTVVRKNIEAGETVAAGTPVLTIAKLDDPWIKVYVRENRLGLVKLGQKAMVMTDTFPEKIYEGTVTYIASEAEFTPRNIQTHEERVKLVFAVKVSVRNENDELKPGMPADVKIPLSVHDPQPEQQKRAPGNS